MPLDPQDLEFKKMKKWDGVTAYAFSKRAQIALTEYWGGIKFDNAAEVTDATRPGNPLFLSMHPGWADTPGVEKSLSAFHRAMQGRLRTPEMGADTIIWAAVASRSVLTATGVKNGAFLFGRKLKREERREENEQ